MTGRSPLPRSIGWLLRSVPLGDRRADVEHDFAELFEVRSRERGAGYATLRFLADFISLIPPLRRHRGLFQDLRFGLRLFRKHPGAIAIATIGLALAIGAVTSVYSILNAVLLRPYKMDDPSSVYSVTQPMHSRPWPEWPYDRFLNLQRRATLTDVVASLYETARIATTQESEGAEEVPFLFVSGNYLGTLGGRPAIGRTLVAADDVPGAPPVVVASYFTWTSRLNADASLVGKTIYVNGSPATLVGVISAAFDGPIFQPSAYWAPLSAFDDLLHGQPFTESTTTHVEVHARVRPAGSAAAAASELQAIAANDQRPAAAVKAAAPTSVELYSAATPSSGLKAIENYAATAAILALIGLVLALACANAANLMLAGAATRIREIGLRLALGASRRRLVRQLVTEGLLLGLIAGGLGVIVAVGLAPMLASAFAIPPAVDVSLDMRVLIFAIVVAVTSGLGAAIAPARYGVRGNLVTALNAQSGQTGEAPRTSRLRKVFVAFQAAVSIVLLIGAALLTRTALKITGAGLGFDADRLLAVTSSVASASVEQPGYIDSAIETIRAVPLVERASVSQYQPFGMSVERARLDGGSYTLYRSRTDEEYFATMGLQIVRGRGFTREEVATEAPVTLLSEDVVRRYFNGVDPIGQPLAGMEIAPARQAPPTVIGVVAEMMPNRIRTEGYGVMYLPISRKRSNAPTIVVRAQHPAAAARAIETALLQAHPRARPITEVIGADAGHYLQEKRMMAALSTAAAGLALGLAVLGIYGVTAFVIGQRAHEIGVRMAIGASRADIVRLLVGQSLRPVAIGLAIGVTVVLLGGQVLASFIAGVGPRDPIAIGSAIVILVFSALAAVVAPARRAARVDPVTILRV